MKPTFSPLFQFYLINNCCFLFLSVPVGYLYVTCLIQNCSDKMVTAQFLGKIDHNSLLVQDDYIFVKVNNITIGGVNGRVVYSLINSLKYLEITFFF